MKKEGTISLKGLTQLDNLSVDRRYGICPIPLYEFNEADMEMLQSRSDIPAIRERLHELGIYDFFFPPVDALAVGFVDGGVTTQAGVTNAVAVAEGLGHQVASPVLVDATDDVARLLAELKESGHVAEGELGLEIGPNGRTFRASVKFRPQESMFSRVLQRVNLTINPSNFLPGGH